MHLAILMTNTDESAFAQSRPKDGEKFTRLVHLARPDWTTEVFAVKDDVFPDDITRFDGVIVTGSPASTLGDAPWIARLLVCLRQAHDAGVALFGACFGHQAIALALGGQVGRNPGGWVHGLTRNRIVERTPWTRDLRDPVRLYASHCEQVTVLPPDARIIASSEDCPAAGFVIGRTVYTTQHHPEMTRAFITDLTEELAGEMGTDLARRARASLGEEADMAAFAESVARFFEQAQD